MRSAKTLIRLRGPRSLIRVFADRRSLIVGFVVRWLNFEYCYYNHQQTKLNQHLTYLYLMDSSTLLFGQVRFQFKGCQVCFWCQHLLLNFLYLMRTVSTLIRRRVLRRRIWVYTVCQCPFYGALGINVLTANNINMKIPREGRYLETQSSKGTEKGYIDTKRHQEVQQKYRLAKTVWRGCWEPKPGFTSAQTSR